MRLLRFLQTVEPAAAMTMLPFLDVVFSTIGVFVIVFALQEVVRHESGRRPAVDSLIVCTNERELTLHLTPDAEPQTFSFYHLPRLFEALATSGQGIRNLVFAFNRHCISRRQYFEGAWARFTAWNRRQPDRAAVALRLSFRPLSVQPVAVERLLDHWRGGQMS